MLDFDSFQKTNHQRALRWHKNGKRDWSVLEWAGAMCGEAGETANVAKKLLRIELDLDGNAFSEHKLDKYALTEKLGNEIADTIIYASLLASHHGLNLEDIVRNTFNNKSKEAGFPEML